MTVAATTGPTRVWTQVDFAREGKQSGHFYIPHSDTRSAYGNLAVPMVSIRNGAGPTILLMAGNHGDEFEGQVVCCRIARALQAGDIQGHLIVVPAVNYPAAAGGQRVSTVDDANLNRSFPGSPDGNMTQQIAHYLDSVLMPMADVVIDLHSGGSSLDYLPTAFVTLPGDPQRDARAVEALSVFGAPLSLLWAFYDDTRLAHSSAHRNGCLYFCTELGGTASIQPHCLDYSYAGSVRLLQHFGLLRRSAALEPFRGAERTRYVEIPDRSFHVYAPATGLFEPRFRLGDVVRKGDLAGLTYFIEEPLREPVPSYFANDGFVICKRHYAQSRTGDCLVHIAVDRKP
jgi:predicted deacylase